MFSLHHSAFTAVVNFGFKANLRQYVHSLKSLCNFYFEITTSRDQTQMCMVIHKESPLTCGGPDGGGDSG